MRISSQVLGLNLDGEVDIVRGKGLASVNGSPGQGGIIKDIEGNTDWDALIRARSRWLCSRP